MTVLRRFRSASDGQAAVEFALVLPLLLMFIVGIVEFGRAWNESQVITDAAREAARRCVVAGGPADEADIKQVAKRAMAAAIDTVGADAAIQVDGAASPPGESCTVVVRMPYHFTFFGPLVQWTTQHSTITLSASSTMRKE